jgi:hypothetical protein
MDHELIDRALAQLTATLPSCRTPEMIQGWARFICAAAGAEVESTTRVHSEWIELRASVALLAAELDGASFCVSLDAYREDAPELKAFIFIDAKTAVYSYGNSAEQALQRLKEDVKFPRPKEAA